MYLCAVRVCVLYMCVCIAGALGTIGATFKVPEDFRAYLHVM